MHYNVYQLLMLFLAYSFLGWCVEVSFVAVTTGRVVNRGFLNGPVCPIYGVGMLGALLLLEPVSDNLVLLFFLGMLLCTLVELIGGWILELAFHTRWWDYTDKPFNLGGYVCLGFSIMWGFAVTFAVRLIHPLVFSLVCWLPHLVGWILIGVLYALFLIDFVLTLITVIGLRKQLGELERVGQALHTVGDTISDRLGNSALAADAKLESAKLVGQERVAEGKEKLETAMENSQKKLELARGKQSEKAIRGQGKAGSSNGKQSEETGGEQGKVGRQNLRIPSGASAEEAAPGDAAKGTGIVAGRGGALWYSPFDRRIPGTAGGNPPPLGGKQKEYGCVMTEPHRLLLPGLLPGQFITAIFLAYFHETFTEGNTVLMFWFNLCNCV